MAMTKIQLKGGKELAEFVKSIGSEGKSFMAPAILEGAREMRDSVKDAIPHRSLRKTVRAGRKKTTKRLVISRTFTQNHVLRMLEFGTQAHFVKPKKKGGKVLKMTAGKRGASFSGFSRGHKVGAIRDRNYFRGAAKIGAKKAAQTVIDVAKTNIYKRVTQRAQRLARRIK